MACKCGKTDCKSSGDSTTDVPRSYDNMQVVLYGVGASLPWTGDPPIVNPWTIETGTELKIPEVSQSTVCSNCKTVLALQNLIEMLLKRVDTLEKRLDERTEAPRPRKKRSSRSK